MRLTKSEIHVTRMKIKGKKATKRITITEDALKNIKIIAEEENKPNSKVVEEAIQYWIELKRRAEREY